MSSTSRSVVTSAMYVGGNMNRQIQICVLNISLATILTVAGAVSITRRVLAGHLVVLITKFPASFRHSISSHLFIDSTGTFGHGVMGTVTLGLLAVSLWVRTELSMVATMSVFSEAAVTISGPGDAKKAIRI